MIRRCVLELSSSRSIGRRHRMIAAQTPYFLSSRNEFSTAPPRKPQAPPVQTPPPAAEGTSGSGRSVGKFVIGGVVIGGAALAAYQTGYIDLGTKVPKDEKHSSYDIVAAATTKHAEQTADHAPLSSVETPTSGELKPSDGKAEGTENNHLKDLDVNRETVTETKPAELKENDLPELAAENKLAPRDEMVGSVTSSEGNVNVHNSAATGLEQEKQPENSAAESSAIESSIQPSEENATSEAASDQDTPKEEPKVLLDEEGVARTSLADSYSLQEDEIASSEREETDALVAFLNEKEVSVAGIGKAKDENKPADEKVILDLIEAIHAAEKRQFEKDTYVFSEEKRKLKEKYEKELKDARARELMYAEEAAILEKELNKEKAKAAAAIKSLQEKAEQKLQEELQRKEEEADIQLKKAQELAKAELAAAIAREKASQIEKIAEADMNIKALCMAFYARSEESRQTHSVHKLALGTLALEDALSNGLPIRAEVDTLQKSLEGIDKDSLLELVLSSLPEEVLDSGADTHMQLNQKFDSLKGALRHFSLIPAGGGGLVAHAVAHVASSIKMREDQSGHGIESLISKVEGYLVDGQFVEAAEALEGGVRGSEAEGVIADWVRQARNRAVTEQALSLFQSYAASFTFS